MGRCREADARCVEVEHARALAMAARFLPSPGVQTRSERAGFVLYEVGTWQPLDDGDGDAFLVVGSSSASFDEALARARRAVDVSRKEVQGREG